MRLPLVLLALILAAPAATSQVIHPNQYASAVGDHSNSYPFNYSQGAGHYQQAHDAAQFNGPLNILEIAFRYKDDKAVPAATCDLKVTMSHSVNPWTSLSTTFANNLGAGSKKVFDGVWSLPAFNGDPASPNPFTARLVLTSPFSYDPSLGDLLIDVEVRQATGGKTGAFAASHNGVGAGRVFNNNGNPTSPTGYYGNLGLITEFTGASDIIPYGTGCAGAGGFVPVLAMTGTPKIGQQVNLALDKALGGAMSALMISLGQTSAPLGGGCTLLVSGPQLIVFIPLGGSGAGGGAYLLPAVIPLATPPATIYMQAFVADPAAFIGMSVSNGLEVKIS